MVKLVLYQPEIPQNAGTLLRLGACMGVPVHIIEPCGFILSNRRLRRSGMDYLDTAEMIRHENWQAFSKENQDCRRILLTPHAEQSYWDFTFQKEDFLVLGQESCGVPKDIFEGVEGRVLIPMKNQMRSLNVAVAAAMVLGEALRQTTCIHKE